MNNSFKIHVSNFLNDLFYLLYFRYEIDVLFLITAKFS